MLLFKEKYDWIQNNDVSQNLLSCFCTCDIEYILRPHSLIFFIFLRILQRDIKKKTVLTEICCRNKAELEFGGGSRVTFWLYNLPWDAPHGICWELPQNLKETQEAPRNRKIKTGTLPLYSEAIMKTPTTNLITVQVCK